MHLERLSDIELEDILLTADGKGRAIKKEALDELLKRAYTEGSEMDPDIDI